MPPRSGPLGQLYARVAAAKAARIVPYRSSLPVICLGNFTAGGGGKTPAAIAVAELLKSLGQRPAFLTRGYGGKIEGPHFVREGDSAEEVGDEPLLLARTATVMVARDRTQARAPSRPRGTASSSWMTASRIRASSRICR